MDSAAKAGSASLIDLCARVDARRRSSARRRFSAPPHQMTGARLTSRHEWHPVTATLPLALLVHSPTVRALNLPELASPRLRDPPLSPPAVIAWPESVAEEPGSVSEVRLPFGGVVSQLHGVVQCHQAEVYPAPWWLDAPAWLRPFAVGTR